MLAVLFFFLLFVSIITLVVVARIQETKREKQRTEGLQSVAEELDCDFEPAASIDSIPGIDHFALGELADSEEIKNLIWGEVDGVPVTVFDYIYTVGSRRPTTFFQTVVLFEPEDQSFPNFTLRPEEVFDKMFSAFGYQDIDFEQRPEFSRLYILRGKDEAAIRRLFNDRLLSFYENNPGTFTDAGDTQLFVYRAHQRLRPDEIEPYVVLGIELLSLMKGEVTG